MVKKVLDLLWKVFPVLGAIALLLMKILLKLSIGPILFFVPALLDKKPVHLPFWKHLILIYVVPVAGLTWAEKDILPKDSPSLWRVMDKKLARVLHIVYSTLWWMVFVVFMSTVFS